MEGLTAFVSRFDKGKPENRRTQTDPKAERDHNNMPSASSNLVSLPFSIAEILSDKRTGPRVNQTDDPQNEIRSYNVQGKKENYSYLNPLEMHVRVCYLSPRCKPFKVKQVVSKLQHKSLNDSFNLK